MKLKAIEKICKNSGIVHLIDDVCEMDPEELPEEGQLPRQWISDGVACYPLD